MIPQFLQRVALRSIHVAASRSTVLTPSLVATRLPGPTRSFLTASQPRFARTSSATSATKAKGTKAKTTTTKKTSAKKSKSKTKAKAKPKAKASPKPKKPKKVTFKLRELPPKGPPGPTALFIREYFETHPKPPNVELGKEYLVGAINAYNALDAASKQRYSDRSKKLSEEHGKAIEEWYRNIEPDKLKVIKQYMKAKHRRMPINPAGSRPGNVYALFTAQYHKDHPRPGAPLLESVKVVAEAWKALPEEEKARYRDEAKKRTEEWQAKQANVQ